MGNESYALRVVGWRARSRRSRVFFPADSLRDLGVTQLATGTEVSGDFVVSMGSVAVRPSGLWRRERLDGREADGTTFFETSPAGDSDLYQLGLGISVGPWVARGSYRSRKVDLDSRLFRLDASAGRLFFARVDLSRWSAGLGRHQGSGLWSLTVSRERSEGALSTRVETWPFTNIWGQLTSQAFRLRGRLDAESWVGRLGREADDPDGWTWGAELGRYRVRADRDSWYVTSFGFGRADRQRTTSGADPALVLGGDVGRAFPVRAGRVGVHVHAGLPVQADELGATAPTSGDGIAGYAGVVLAWSW